MPSFSCPKCKKVLKTSTPMLAGKNVKCPGCGHLFTVAAAGTEKTAPATPPRKRAGVAAEQDQLKRRRPDGDEDAPRRSSALADPDEEEQPSRPRSKNKAGSKSKLILILGVAGVLLIALGVAGFIWPGFLVSSSSKAPAGPVDLFTFLPNNTPAVFGANKPGQVALFEKLVKKSAELTPERLELFNSADVIVGGVIDQEGSSVVAVSSLAPLDSERVRKAMNAGPAQTIQGKTIYKLDSGKGKIEHMAMPNNKTIVVATVPEAEFVKILEGRGQVPPALQAQVSALKQKHVWVVADAQKALQGKTEQVEMVSAFVPEAAQILPALKRATTISVSLAAPKEGSLQVDLQCASEEDATAVETQGRILWETKAKPLLPLATFGLIGQLGIKGAAALVGDVTNTFKIERQGMQVSLSVTLSENTLKELENFQPPKAPNPGGIEPGFEGKVKQKKS